MILHIIILPYKYNSVMNVLREDIFMFIYSLKAGTLKFFGVICLSLALLITLIAFVPTLADDSAPAGSIKTDGAEDISYEKKYACNCNFSSYAC